MDYVELSSPLNSCWCCPIMQGHQYETVSGFVCEAFGYIPRTGETIKVVIERANQEDHGDYDGSESDHEDDKEKTHIFKLEVCLFYYLP